MTYYCLCCISWNLNCHSISGMVLNVDNSGGASLFMPTYSVHSCILEKISGIIIWRHMHGSLANLWDVGKDQKQFMIMCKQDLLVP